MDALKDRVIAGASSAEADWLTWLASTPIEPLDTAALFGPASTSRLVVVAPHPDDEVLACGGLVAEHALRGGHCLVIAVTDGDASHLGSAHWSRRTLGDARRDESAAGLRLLGLPDEPVLRLGLPDADVAQHRAALEARLLDALAPGDTVLTTWRLDGHPDHDATGQAVASACAAIGATLLEAPVWMWHWSAPGDARVPWHRLRSFAPGDPALQRKRAALSAHVTQLTPRDQADGSALEPVLGDAIVQRSSRLLEYFFVA